MQAASTFKRMGAADPAASGTSPSLQFFLVELARSAPAPVLDTSASQCDIRIELQRGGVHLKLQCTASACALYTAQFRALADALCAA